MDTLRAHGYKVPYTCDGPFWAMKDGCRFLQEYGRLA